MSLISIHNRYSNSVPLPSIRKPFRFRKKCVIFIIFSGFVLMLYGFFFYFPELRTSSKTKEKAVVMYQQLQYAGPQLLIPTPSFADEVKRPLKPNMRHFDHQNDDLHIIEDRSKLRAKIEEESKNQKLLQKPDILMDYKSNLDTNSNVMEKSKLNEPVVFGGEDPNEDIQLKRGKIVEMMKHAWNGYEKYAWGMNELKPISKTAHNNSVFGIAPLGATIVDGLDTLYIMGLHEEFKRGRDWIAEHLNVEDINLDLSVFEVNIRFVGGLLSCYALTGDTIFRDKAESIAKKLLPAFQTPTGIPYALINFKTSNVRNYYWASISSSILSEFGTLHLEFSYLSDVTENNVFKNKVNQIRRVLKNIEKPKGLYPNYMNPKTGKWGHYHISVGGLGDSFYEYLLKSWIQSGEEDLEAREMFDDAMKAVLKYLLQTSAGGLIYLTELKFDKLEKKMDALACFAGGMFGLGSKTLANDLSDEYMRVAKGLATTCHEAYNRSTVKLAPESFWFLEGSEAKAAKSNEKYYIQRPETVETYFMLWRLTHDTKYRKWGWEVVEALQKYCRSDAGYSGLKNVYVLDPVQDDVQQSYLLAEMLKYLYLLFSDDKLISLEEWVFNSEAHPLPIKNRNSFYRAIL